MCSTARGVSERDRHKTVAYAKRWMHWWRAHVYQQPRIICLSAKLFVNDADRESWGTMKTPLAARTRQQLQVQPTYGIHHTGRSTRAARLAALMPPMPGIEAKRARKVQEQKRYGWLGNHRDKFPPADKDAEGMHAAAPPPSLWKVSGTKGSVGVEYNGAWSSRHEKYW